MKSVGIIAAVALLLIVAVVPNALAWGCGGWGGPGWSGDTTLYRPSVSSTDSEWQGGPGWCWWGGGDGPWGSGSYARRTNTRSTTRPSTAR
jgi:hypothetical protein